MVFIFSNSVLAKIIKFRITAIMLNGDSKLFAKVGIVVIIIE